MPIQSRNPATEEIMRTFDELTESDLQLKLEKASSTFSIWKNSSIQERAEHLRKLAATLEQNKDIAAKAATLEVGQPISAAKNEIDKCILLCNYYADNLGFFLISETVKTEAHESYITYEPMGVILGIAPWNFPYWMALRFIIPTISAGNTVVLKHASNVPESAQVIEYLLLKAGFPEGVMQTLLVSSDKVASLIENPVIKGVSFAGSETAGSIVASQSAKAVKKSLLELGGNDAFIVLPDANLEIAAKVLVDNRLRNAGQACNSPKRTLIPDTQHDQFLSLVLKEVEKTNVGDPLDEKTDMGPLSSQNALEHVHSQVEKSIQSGAKLEKGGKRINRTGFFYEPTILSNVKPGMPVFDEEVFGPVIAITTYSSIEEAIQLANKTKYGLGASLWTENAAEAKQYIPLLETGNVFINQPVRSDVRLPFGGTKHSGYGRELGAFGIKEFMNVKSVVIKG